MLASLLAFTVRLSANDWVPTMTMRVRAEPDACSTVSIMVNGPWTSPACRARLERIPAIAYALVLVVAMRTTLAPATGVPVIAVDWGKKETMPWMPPVMGDCP